MKQLLVLIPLLFGLLGCVESLHPFYKDDQLFYDSRLSGTWTDADHTNKIVVEGNAKDKDYFIDYTNKDGKTGQFIVHLAKVHDQLIADIYPTNMENQVKSGDEYRLFLVPVHSFMIVEYSPPDVRVRQMDLDWFNKYIEAHPKEIQVETLEKDRPLLSASTEKVQEFVLRHLNTPGAYSDEQNLIRVATTQP